MNSRRGILCALVLVSGLALAAVNPVSASAQVQPGLLASPSASWGVATQERPNGMGQWVYVAPIPQAGPGQAATTGYRYGLTFYPEAGSGVIALSTDDQGPVAAIGISGSGPYPATATVRYDWAPGNFYYLLTYHLGDGLWAGWVYDNTRSTWTVIGAVQAPTSGLLSNLAFSGVFAATGGTPCAALPRVDAYFYPPVEYFGTTFALAELVGITPINGNQCPVTATIEYDWAHFRLGSPAT